MLKNNFNNNNNGFSLIEIMIAFLILVIAFIGLIQAFPFSQIMIKTAENSSKASYLAQDKIEQLLSLGYDNVSIGTIETKQRLATSSTDYLYYFQRQTTVDYLDGNLQVSASSTGMKKISTTVYYTNNISKTEKSYNISTIISQR
ncbi:prepilin-type N-terminal cleavage/methylation domain-containing protein [Patescibacteria group bacterium]|nr:prepilin-type N-terminal cleavage/methylation domain-containing protein [Patescibacteria group bacterium]MBU0879687.1 prepilin-type N-terminal cleavage/methylation domain-containing protein [Patescibacteria group bacterium]MBU0880278.1 prepilin-type N-terminal cleavage/methylation domain-containing protein [Patescibacteria group bacterium]MBU0897785.1 prepilin-type N-terminal cleavage/methylation domain-containing protein [Patescibacteria group bacterium]MBU1063100.1 prepilin-type N-terminal